MEFWFVEFLREIIVILRNLELGDNGGSRFYKCKGNGYWFEFIMGFSKSWEL